MRICPECPARMRIVRVILDGTATWREHECLGPGKHKFVTRQELGDAREYRRIRAKYISARRGKDDSPIIKVHRRG
jgi:hypothetical protein